MSDEAASIHFKSPCYFNGSVALFRQAPDLLDIVQHFRKESNEEKSQILIVLLARLCQMMLLEILRPLRISYSATVN